MIDPGIAGQDQNTMIKGRGRRENTIFLMQFCNFEGILSVLDDVVVSFIPACNSS